MVLGHLVLPLALPLAWAARTDAPAARPDPLAWAVRWTILTPLVIEGLLNLRAWSRGLL